MVNAYPPAHRPHRRRHDGGVPSRWGVDQAPTASALAAGVRAGRVDPVELVEAALSRLAACDDDVGAFVEVDADAARDEARRRAQDRTGPLCGVPVGVKDLFDVAGQRTRAGSLVPPGPPAAADAVAVGRLRAAGAVVLGRTRTHEFAWGLTTRHPTAGGTANPWDTSRTAGGSSGGSAAAVAAGVVPLALGTDTGCSVRLPAAWCGLVGHKPTHGSVPLDGVVPLAPSLDCVGALVRTVEDAVLAHGVLSGRPLDLPDAAGVRAGVAVLPDDVDPAVAAAVERAAGVLGAAPVRLPEPDGLQRTYAVVQGAEAVDVHTARGWWPAHGDEYGADVRARVAWSAGLSAAERAAGARDRTRTVAELDALLAGVDVLLLLVAATGPSTVQRPDARPDGRGPLRAAVLPWTAPANLAGLPACAVPAGHDADGLPVGVQVVGRRGDDALVLAVARRLESAGP